MWLYTYMKYSTKEIVFTCKAANILEADSQYEQVLGKDPAKENDVGCSMVEIKE